MTLSGRSEGMHTLRQLARVEYDRDGSVIDAGTYETFGVDEVLDAYRAHVNRLLTALRAVADDEPFEQDYDGVLRSGDYKRKVARTVLADLESP